MPRRAPPTALLLAQGPTPPRSAPKHTLPSVPRPTFCPPSAVTRGPSPLPRHSPRPSDADTRVDADFESTSLSPRSATTPLRSGSPLKLRGPWDHSGSIPVPFDGKSLLTPLKPAALSV